MAIKTAISPSQTHQLAEDDCPGQEEDGFNVEQDDRTATCRTAPESGACRGDGFMPIHRHGLFIRGSFWAEQHAQADGNNPTRQ